MKTDCTVKIYHNTNCSKSCAALELLLKNGNTPEVVHYLEETPTREELRLLLQLLQLKPLDLIRTKEPLFQENFSHLTLSDEKWLDILLTHPILIERPIIIKGDKAVIGRPIERIFEIIDRHE
ncbi:MAG: arsenate reductase (glutaredoxin) [Sphingobacterium sp.]|jgi:arsenate reductase|nr:arsenate reductase (glutaredoxin) [Sphingobacterium sp.]